jgi:hypothetical protein
MSLEQAIQENTQALHALIEQLKAGTQAVVLTAPIRAPLSEIAPVLAEVPINNPAPEPDYDTMPVVTEVTEAELRAMFIAFAKTAGREGQMAALAKFGVAKLSELPADKFSAMTKFISTYGDA